MACSNTTTKDNNQTINRIMLEDDAGQINNPAGQFADMRLTSNGLVENSDTAKSEEIRADRNIQEHIQVAISVAGDLGVEISYGSHDQLFAGLLSNDWTAAVAYTAATIAISGSTGTNDLQLDNSISGFVPADFPVGKFFRVSGFTGANTNDHYAQVKAAATSTAIPIYSPTLVAEVEGDSVTLKSSGMLRNGVCYKSFTVEKEELDTLDFYQWLGCVMGSAQLEISPQAIFKGTFSVAGNKELRSLATVGNGSSTAQTTTPIYNTTSNIAMTLQDGQVAAFSFTDFSIAIDNEVRQDVASGSLAPKQNSLGSFNASATVSIFNSGNEDLYAKYKAQTTHRFSFIFADILGNVYIFTIHKAKINSAQNPLPGLNTTRMIEIAITGQYDDETASTFQIDRISA